ncbi:MAG: hypothetical protein ACMUIP_11810 [bacterium]
MVSNFLQDWLINKLNGFFLICYANGHIGLASIIEQINDLLVLFLVFTHLIPRRQRLNKNSESS